MINGLNRGDRGVDTLAFYSGKYFWTRSKNKTWPSFTSFNLFEENNEANSVVEDWISNRFSLHIWCHTVTSGIWVLKLWWCYDQAGTWCLSALWEDLGKQADIILYHPASSSAASSVTSFMSPASSSSLFLSPLLVSATEKTITPTSWCDSSAPSSDSSYFRV